MTTPPPQTPTAPPAALVAAIASYLQARDQLANNANQAPLMPARIIAFASGQALPDRDQIAAQLSAQLPARRLYRQVLALRSVAHSPLQACAQSEGTITERSGDHFVLYFRASRAAPDQVYVTVEIRPSLQLVEGAELDIHVLGERQVLSVRFPPLVERRTQRLFQRTDAVLQLLQDDGAELMVVQP